MISCKRFNTMNGFLISKYQLRVDEYRIDIVFTYKRMMEIFDFAAFVYSACEGIANARTYIYRSSIVKAAEEIDNAVNNLKCRDLKLDNRTREKICSAIRQWNQSHDYENEIVLFTKMYGV